MPRRSTSSVGKRLCVAVVAMLALAGCEADPVPAPQAPRPEPSVAAADGGRIDFGVLGEPPALDPYDERASDLTYFLARPVYRSLYRTMPDGVVEPDLAASLTSEGRRSVVVELRRARWSDDRPITASDVVRSVERARYPSGFAGLTAEATGPRTVRLTGDVSGDWAVRLADGTFVVPRRADLTVGSGPFVVTQRTPGLEMVYEPNPRAEDPPNLNRIRVRFIASLDIMLALLEDGKLDAAAPPSAMNLDERVAEIGLTHSEILGREAIALDMAPTGDDELRSSIASSVDIPLIAEGLIRDQGRAIENDLPDPSPGNGVEIQLGTASGDELLQLMQRIIQKNLLRSEIRSELVQVDPPTLYGEWKTGGPLDVGLRREVVPSFRSLGVGEDLEWVPLAKVESFVVWNDGVVGLLAHGGLDGPLWNAHEWSLE
jgi:ABC-type transport system substrate-binding protein